jgi:ferric iron reductase protein FhuF
MKIDKTKLSLSKATAADIETLVEHRIIFTKIGDKKEIENVSLASETDTVYKI